jgi:hypothetical protein
MDKAEFLRQSLGIDVPAPVVAEEPLLAEPEAKEEAELAIGAAMIDPVDLAIHEVEEASKPAVKPKGKKRGAK